MYKISLGLFVWLLLVNPAYATIQAGDTLSTPYLNAIQHWLYGRNALAKQTLKEVASHAVQAERDAARYLLLDELYFWPGRYNEYLHLADSMGFHSSNYEMARLLASQPALRIYLLKDSLQIPFAFKHKGHVVINMQINGRSIRLAVDSGAQRTTISQAVAKRMGLKSLAVVSLTNYDGQSVPASIGLADSLILNGLYIYNLPIVAASLPIPGIDGLLGWDVLRQFALLIDYPKSQLILHQSIPDSTLEPNLLGGSRLMLSLRSASGNQLNFVLDTGSDEKLRISPTGLTKIGPYQIGRETSIGSSVGRRIRVGIEKQVRRLTISIDNKKQQFRRTILYKSDEIIGQFRKDGLIGGASFRKGRLLLDAPNHHFSYID